MGSIVGQDVATGKALQLPVINISAPNLEMAKHMLGVATKYGFLYIDTESTGFTKQKVDRMFDISKDFFALPVEEKQQFMSGTNSGYTGMYGEVLDPKNQRKGDFKEIMDIFEFDADGKPQQPMPPVLEVDEVEDFAQICRRTSDRILEMLAIGLEIEEPNFLSSRHKKPSGTVLRMLLYPAMAEDVDYQPAVDVRAGAHSDYGSLTLLFQRDGQPGLEIRTPEDEWAPVPVIPEGYSGDQPPILINIADLMSYWTNGLLKTTVHRVIFPKEARKGGEDRYSIAFFYHPANDTELVPIPSRLVKELAPIEDGTEVGYGGGAATKRAITAHEHLVNRLTATYITLEEK